jgi:predicted aspartyl protease
MPQVGRLTTGVVPATRARVENFLRKKLLLAAVFFGLSVSSVTRCSAAVPLNTLGQFLSAHGYGGAQLVRIENFYRIPISSNGKAGDLIIDTGAPTSVVFRESLKKLALNETRTDMPAGGAFGKGTEFFGKATIHSLTMGNCTLVNVPAVIASDRQGSGMFRQYGSSDGLFGLHEMVQYGAILDLGSRLLFVRPAGPSGEIAAAVKSILLARGYTAVDLSVARSYLRVSASINGWPCHLLVDTGAFVTAIDTSAAAKARIGGVRTELIAQGVGSSSSRISIARFPSLRVGNYEIKRASAAVLKLSSDLLAAGTDLEMAGLLGVEYLGKNSAVFDFNSNTLYLKANSTR